MLGGLDQNIDRVLGRAQSRRGDGALVRVSTPVGAGDEVEARSRLLSFADLLDRQLAEHWPSESLRTRGG